MGTFGKALRVRKLEISWQSPQLLETSRSGGVSPNSRKFFNFLIKITLFQLYLDQKFSFKTTFWIIEKR